MNTMTTGSSGWATDEPITHAIEREIQARIQPHAPPIDVSAQGATVTLTGHVARSRRRRRPDPGKGAEVAG